MAGYPDQSQPDQMPDSGTRQLPAPFMTARSGRSPVGSAAAYRPQTAQWIPGEVDRPQDPGHDREPVPGRGEDETWAILSYMSAAIFGFGPPLVIYLLKKRGSPVVRAHAVQAVNTAATTFLYIVCAAIAGGMLALDSVSFALATAGPAAVVLWLLALNYLVRAAVAASRGTSYRIPGWLCATFLRR
jgi:uncharacterized Tic20 family protein